MLKPWLNTMHLFPEGSAGGSGDKKVEISEVELNAMKESLKTVTTLQNSFNQMKTDNEIYQKKLAEYESLLGSETGIKQLMSNKGQQIASPSQKVNYNEFSNEQIVEHVLGLVKGEFDQFGKSFQKTVEDFDSRVNLGFAKADTQLSALRHHAKFEEPGFDFISLKDSVQEKLKTNPDYSAEKAYQEVVKDKRIAVQIKAEADAKTAVEKKASFTEKGGIPDSLIKDKTLDGAAAAAKAMELVGPPPSN